MSSPSKCPVCGSTSTKPLSRIKTKAATGYKCSRGHTFETALPERVRSRQLRTRAQEMRPAADEQVERAQKLLAKRHS